MIKTVVKLRFGQTGDGKRPLGWKKIANQLGTNLDKIRELRRSDAYLAHVIEICSSIGIVRLQAKAARKTRRIRSLNEWIENIFGLDTFLAEVVTDIVDENPLPMRNAGDRDLSEEEIEFLVEETEKLIIEPTNTISLTRKHVKWLLSQGYDYKTDRIILRAAAMTRDICSRKEPPWLKKKQR